ncbi:hypothetical protein BT96DRAFT_949211 [Gymnopus androsaceus JB14]|uniref:Uncharacterized protein n=1 Tax=Gymnopus androsaceus JB14 TaxID=1447944 RepID=A0A6A4GKP2_9AGAR|nr:hypothetical protein BT96DRAFT_949211 [Gymnopus androsaceus JB14]
MVFIQNLFTTLALTSIVSLTSVFMLNEVTCDLTLMFEAVNVSSLWFLLFTEFRSHWLPGTSYLLEASIGCLDLQPLIKIGKGGLSVKQQRFLRKHDKDECTKTQAVYRLSQLTILLIPQLGVTAHPHLVLSPYGVYTDFGI